MQLTTNSFKKTAEISAKGQNLDFSEAMAAILENGGHNFTLNPHLFIFSTSVLVSSSSSSNFTYLISKGLACKSVYIL